MKDVVFSWYISGLADINKVRLFPSFFIHFSSQPQLKDKETRRIFEIHWIDPPLFGWMLSGCQRSVFELRSWIVSCRSALLWTQYRPGQEDSILDSQNDVDRRVSWPDTALKV